MYNEDRQALQKIFDRCARHLLTQRRKSLSSTSAYRMCCYRSSNGRMCAAGIFISDENYHPSLEGKSIYEGSVRAALEPAVRNYTDLLGSLQRVHDDKAVKDWPFALTQVANCERLSADIVEALAPEGGDWRPVVE